MFDAAAESTKLLARDAEWATAASDGKDVEKILSSLRIPGFRIHWVSEKVAFSPDGRMAYMTATNEITVPGPTGSPMTLRGRGITVWRLEPDGQWKCVVDIWNNPPGPTPAAN